MLAPGLPDELFGDGSHLGWTTTEGLWILHEDEACLVPAAFPVGVSIAPERWLIVQGQPGGWTVTAVHPRGLQPQRWTFHSRGITVGAAWLVCDLGIQRQVISLDSGNEVSIPDGAADARPQPWTDEPGLVWTERESVYRMGSDMRVRVAGTLPAPPADWRVGPSGAAVFEVAGELWGMAPQSSPVLLFGAHLEGLRFSPSGLAVLVFGAEGIVEHCLRTGAELWRLDGHFVPVGYAPDAVFLDEISGRIRDREGVVRAEGFNPSAATLSGTQLYGPGGTAWDLKAGKRMWAHAPLVAEHLSVVGSQILALGGGLTIYSLEGDRVGHRKLPHDPETEGPIVDVHPTADGYLLIELQDGFFELYADGQRRPPRAEHRVEERVVLEAGLQVSEDPPYIRVAQPQRQWPLAVDGCVTVGQQLWCWNEDGMLCSLNRD